MTPPGHGAGRVVPCRATHDRPLPSLTTGAIHWLQYLCYVLLA